MTGLDIEAIRQRSDASVEVGPPIGGQVVTAAVLHAHWESAQDVPELLAEFERLTVEARDAEFEVVRLRGELARTRAALGNVREHLDLRDSELASANSQRDHARAALADALQVIADLRGGTP